MLGLSEEVVLAFSLHVCSGSEEMRKVRPAQVEKRRLL